MHGARHPLHLHFTEDTRLALPIVRDREELSLTFLESAVVACSLKFALLVDKGNAGLLHRCHGGEPSR